MLEEKKYVNILEGCLGYKEFFKRDIYVKLLVGIYFGGY